MRARRLNFVFPHFRPDHFQNLLRGISGFKANALSDFAPFRVAFWQLDKMRGCVWVVNGAQRNRIWSYEVPSVLLQSDENDAIAAAEQSRSKYACPSLMNFVLCNDAAAAAVADASDEDDDWWWPTFIVVFRFLPSCGVDLTKRKKTVYFIQLITLAAIGFVNKQNGVRGW